METPEIDPSAIESSPTAKPSKLAWLWPAITTEEEAKKAAKNGAYAAVIVAVLTSAISLIAIVAKEPVLGLDGWGIVDALVFAIIAWRIFKFSFPWAIIGLLFYCAEMYWKWSRDGTPKGNVIVPVLIVLALIAGVRGTAFLSKRENLVAPIIVIICASAFAIAVHGSVLP